MCNHGLKDLFRECPSRRENQFGIHPLNHPTHPHILTFALGGKPFNHEQIEPLWGLCGSWNIINGLCVQGVRVKHG
jgi:hypothetical protein